MLDLILVAVVGALLGCATGLLPGLHVNTLAVLLVAAAPAAAIAASNLGVEPAAVPLAIAATILAVTVSHTFVNIVPGTYLGAPNDATALSVLPAHRMLLRGHGFRAVQLNAYGSFFAVVASLLLVGPAFWILVGPPNLWSTVRAAIPWLLLALIAFLLLRERAELGPKHASKRVRKALAQLTAASLFLAAGIYGLLALKLPYTGIVDLAPSPLLPMLSGLFGAATLIEALAQQGRVPHQFLELKADNVEPRGAVAALSVGVAAGGAMSLLPGLTNATATAVAGVMRRGNDAEILISLGAVNTANALFNLVVLFLFGRARSGAVVAMEDLVPIDPWHGMIPVMLVQFFFVALTAALVSLVATLALGRWAARRIHRVPYRPLVGGVLAYVIMVVFVFTGWMGLVVLLVGAGLGLVPVRLGLQRTHLTGVLLVPVLAFLLS